jgi:hypothetical protein
MNLLNNTELVSTRLEGTAEELTAIASSESSSSSLANALENNLNIFNTDSISLVNNISYDFILDYHVTEIASTCLPVFVIGVGAFNSPSLFRLSPDIVSAILSTGEYTTPLNQSNTAILKDLLEDKISKNNEIFKYRGYALLNVTMPPMSQVVFLSPAWLSLLPTKLLTPLNPLTTTDLHSSYICNLKKSSSFWCNSFPEVEAYPSTITLTHYFNSIENIENVRMPNTTNPFYRDLQSVDDREISYIMTSMWLATLTPVEEIDPSYATSKIFSWNVAASNSIKDCNLLTKALEGSAVPDGFEDLHIEINKLALSKRFLGNAIAEFNNNVARESFHDNQEQYRFIHHCLDTNNDYLLNLFSTNFYEKPDLFTYDKMLPLVSTNEEIVEQLLDDYIADCLSNTTETFTFTCNNTLLPKETSILVIAADENQLLEELD